MTSDHMPVNTTAFECQDGEGASTDYQNGTIKIHIYLYFNIIDSPMIFIRNFLEPEKPEQS